MAGLRIFSYLPNPRIWKATIAGRLCGVDVELRGAAPGQLQDWLWDFDARPLTEEDRAGAVAGVAPVEGRTGFKGRLFKTEAFLEAHPFGTVPAAFSPDGGTGVFESNSIMRAVARLGGDASGLYGADAYEAARVDGFLDASLVFARDSQIYLLSFRGDGPTPGVHDSAARAFATYMTGIERALSAGAGHIAGPALTLADICFVCEYTLFSRERAAGPALARLGLQPVVSDTVERTWPRALAHYETLCAHPAFAPDLAPYLARLDADIARSREV